MFVKEIQAPPLPLPPTHNNPKIQNGLVQLISMVKYIEHRWVKISSHYKKIDFNINVLHQTACFVVNQVTVGNFAFLFYCMPAGQTSDYMTAPT